ncbi:MAG: glycerol-3-phosphate dehydrogenase [Acidobacteria bacterium]|nr:glycerol-3-phosphate dehydrogenase [Acidobacteriota bacterium]
MKINRNTAAFRETTFDLVVFGGGINGAATAREAALRGLKVALVEAEDFASGTSSRSSKLIHGGLRYLDQFEFHLVREARQERRLLLKLAPHLAWPVPFLLPIYRGDPYSPLKVRLGLSIYDVLGNLGAADRHQMLSRDEILQRVPALKPQGLRAGALYHDSETDDARLTIENVLDAAAHGAAVANYARIRALTPSPRKGSRGPRIIGAEMEDRLNGQRHRISSRFWVNATGPWVDQVRALLPGYDGSKSVRLTKGTHIIIPSVAGDFAIFAAIPPGDRIFVMVPWHGQALLGTTDTDFAGDPSQVGPDRAEVEYLLDAVNRILRRPLQISDVVGAFAGLRALATEPGASPSENTREYRFHQDPWAQNFISICGGKLTTARSLGEKLVDQVVASIGGTMPESWTSHPTRKSPLPGAHIDNLEAYLKEASADVVRMFNIPQTAAERIVKTYGTRWGRVLEPILADRNLANPLSTDSTFLGAEVVHAIQREMAVKIEDFLLRRSGLNWYAPYELREAVPATAQIFAKQLGWSAEERESAIRNFVSSAYPALRRVAEPRLNANEQTAGRVPE